jgi:hypothetical protein
MPRSGLAEHLPRRTETWPILRRDQGSLPDLVPSTRVGRRRLLISVAR